MALRNVTSLQVSLQGIQAQRSHSMSLKLGDLESVEQDDECSSLRSQLKECE